MRIPVKAVPVALLGAALVAAACGGPDRRPDPEVGGAEASRADVVAQVASYELVAGRTGRFIVGVLAADESRLVSFGTVDLRFSYLGTRQRPLKPAEPGPTATASFLPIPGQDVDPAAPGPRFVDASEGVGVYGASDVRFERAGLWEVAVAAAIDGERRTAMAAFEVLDRSPIPAVGELAPRTENPVAGDTAVPAKAIDSRGATGHAIPDPELHSTTVAAAIAAQRPLMVVVSTPTYCQSRFCGPITDSVAGLAKRHGDRMAFVHLEVWRDFEKSEVNPAAKEWISPPGVTDAREPWVFVVGRDGRVTHRFDNVATDAELEAAVQDLLA